MTNALLDQISKTDNPKALTITIQLHCAIREVLHPRASANHARTVQSKPWFNRVWFRYLLERQPELLPSAALYCSPLWWQQDFSTGMQNSTDPSLVEILEDGLGARIDAQEQLHDLPATTVSSWELAYIIAVAQDFNLWYKVMRKTQPYNWRWEL